MQPTADNREASTLIQLGAVALVLTFANDYLSLERKQKKRLHDEACSGP